MEDYSPHLASSLTTLMAWGNGDAGEKDDLVASQIQDSLVSDMTCMPWTGETDSEDWLPSGGREARPGGGAGRAVRGQAGLLRRFAFCIAAAFFHHPSTIIHYRGFWFITLLLLFPVLCFPSCSNPIITNSQANFCSWAVAQAGVTINPTPTPRQFPRTIHWSMQNSNKWHAQTRWG